MAGWNSLPAHSVLAVMVFFGSWNASMLRVDLSFILIDMLPPRVPLIDVDPQCTAARGNVSSDNTATAHEAATIVDYDEATGKVRNVTSTMQVAKGRRGVTWEPLEQANVLAAFFCGQTLAQALGSRVARRTGVRSTVGWCMLLAGALHAAVPMATARGLLAAAAVRFATGLFAGMLLPAMVRCAEHCAPRRVAAVYVWQALGSSAGVVLAWPMGAALSVLLGWQWSFFVTGALAALWGALWLMTGIEPQPEVNAALRSSLRTEVHTQASVHSNGEERGDGALPSPPPPPAPPPPPPPPSPPPPHAVPWCRMYSAPAVQALLCLHCSYMWAEGFLLIHGPLLLRTLMGFDALPGSFLLALCCGGRAVACVLSAAVARAAARNRLCSPLAARKLCALLSHGAPAALLLWLLLRLCGARECSVAVFACAAALSGASADAAPALVPRLTRRHRGALLLLLNASGSAIGVCVALFHGSHSAPRESIRGWTASVGGAAAALAIGGFMFVALGSARMQSWDAPPPARRTNHLPMGDRQTEKRTLSTEKGPSRCEGPQAEPQAEGLYTPE